MTTKDTHFTAPRGFAVRLLSGPLCGCEYPLSAPRTLFLVGQAEALMPAGSPPELPADTLYIPLDSGGINFEIVLTPERTGGMTLRELGPDAHPEQSVIFNEPFKVGSLTLAIRPEQSEWSEAVLACSSAGSASPAPVRTAPRRSKTAAVLLSGLLLTLLAAGYYWQQHNPQRQTLALTSLLGNEPARFQVLPGRDGVLYVAASNERDRSWARQVLARGDYADPASVVSPQHEGERIARWLANHHPELAYYRLLLDNPRQPQLWISRQRAPLAEPQQQALIQQLIAELPYAERVLVQAVDDQLAITTAERGLTRQALPYTRSERPGSVTFVIEGALDDGELLRAQRFVEEYYRQWGTRYVQFAIELKDDWLKGKSFKYGGQGYVKMAPGHWYFPKPL